MAFFDPISGILHGNKLPQIYSDNVSVGQVLLNVLHKSPEKVIQVSDDDDVELTCFQMKELMTNIAKNLYKIGYKSGDIAGLISKNSTFVAPLVFACLLLRLPINPVDTSFSVSKIVELYKTTKPKIIFCDHDIVDKLLTSLAILQSEARVVILTEKINDLAHISEFLSPCNDVCDE